MSCSVSSLAIGFAWHERDSLGPSTEVSKRREHTVLTPYHIQGYRSFTASYPKKLNSGEGDGGCVCHGNMQAWVSCIQVFLSEQGLSGVF